ncbi:MAG: helix-turn-helix domain-containing protein [Terriglobia bacterium]
MVNNPSDFEPLIDAEEAAHLLGLHPKTVQLMARQGTLPAIKVAKFWRFRKSQLEVWVRSSINCPRYAYRQTTEVQS